MTDQHNSPRTAALQELEATLDHWRAQGDGHARPRPEAFLKERPTAPPQKPRWRLPFSPWLLFDLRHPVVRRIAIGIGALVVLMLVAGGALWWRLASGPIMLDLATPWLTSAIEENLGSRYRVQVGGTQLERDAQGRTALRLRDIVVRDAAGALVATAPKAEVGLSGTSLLIARPRAESLRLVDANMVVRVETDGRINVFVGGEQPLVAMAQATAAPASSRRSDRPLGPSLQAMFEQGAAANLAALVAWIDSLGGRNRDGTDAASAGFDGHALTEIGIVNGGITIDDRRDGHQWSLKQINFSLNRSAAGGVALSVGSDHPERPWLFNASLTPRPRGHRALQIEARKILLDDLLALRMSEMKIRADTQLSASVEADIAADGTPHTIGGTVVAEGGSIGSIEDEAHRVPIDRAEFGLDWDAARRTFRMPFKISAGATRLTLRSEFMAPALPGGNWMFAIGGGWIVLDPITQDDEGLVLKRVVVRGRIDTVRQRVTFEQGDFGTKEFGGRDAKDVTIALSGNIDYGADARVTIGLAGNQMSAAALKRLWPIFMAAKVRDWVVDHITAGTVERIDIATNASFASLFPGGPPLVEESLSVEIVGSAATIAPVAGLPPIRDADLLVRVTGRNAIVTLGKGNVEVSPGRRLTVTNGVFEVQDIRIKMPPARVRMRMEGPVPAAAELLTLDRLREFSGAPFDPATTRGNVAAQINLALPLRPDLPKGATTYNIAVELSNFSADRMLLNHKVEAQTLNVIANNQRYELKGEVRIGGTPALLEYRKASTDADAELRLQATLDEAARARLGLDLGPTLTGAFPIRVTARVAQIEKDNRFSIEADLTPVKIDNLLPGWVKPAGRPARAAFVLNKDRSGTRFDDLLIDGQGVLAKGSVEIDANGDLQSANFPVFATSDGDKATVRAERLQDGTLRVVMRGDVYDGRNFVKSAMSGPNETKAKPKQLDLDLDVKIGVVAGHHGEALRGLDLRLTRRGGRIRGFLLNAKIGRDTVLLGDMRNRVSNGRPVLYFETTDAGALFRFTDIYPRMVGGKIWIGMDPPTQDGAPQEGIVSIRDFFIRGEAALDRVVANSPDGAGRNSVEFSEARADFVRIPGRMSIRDGVVRGPVIGATIEGHIDYSRDDVNMRGTLVPLYGINNMFGQIPIVGLFLGGGSNEGLLGITYVVNGPPSNPRLQVNPLSAIAPGLLRKFFEFRDISNDRSFSTDRTLAEPSTR